MITYVTGDATQPVSTPAIIAHICNNRGGWGKGFTGALSKRWKEPERKYRAGGWNGLGDVQFVEVGGGIIVANMIAQNGYTNPGYSAINYGALAVCLRYVCGYAIDFDPPIPAHMPRIGTGLAGGNWAVIEPMIEQSLCSAGISVTVYDLPAR